MVKLMPLPSHFVCGVGLIVVLNRRSCAELTT
jgi:hypothetical protein